MCLPADDKLLDWLVQGVAEGRITEAQAQEILKRRLRTIFGYWPDDKATNRALAGLPRKEVTSDVACDHFRAWKLNNTDRKPVNFCPDCGTDLERLSRLCY